MMLESIGTAVLASVIYSLAFYFKKRQKRSNTQEFRPVKIAATVLVGVVVGVGMHYSGIPLTEVAFEVQLAMYAGIIGVVESVIKSIMRTLDIPRDIGS